MKKELRYCFLYALVPVTIAAFYLESTLPISLGEHTLVQIMLVLGIYWLAWRWVKYDEINRLMEGFISKKISYTFRNYDAVQERVKIPDESNRQPPEKIDNADASERQIPESAGKFSLEKMPNSHRWLESMRQHKN